MNLDVVEIKVLYKYTNPAFELSRFHQRENPKQPEKARLIESNFQNQKWSFYLIF